MTKVTAEAITAHIHAHPGKRFDADGLADHFQVSERSMMASLDSIARSGRIMRIDIPRQSAQYMVPGEPAPLPWQAKFKPLRQDPEMLRRVDELRAHREQFPSGLSRGL